MPAKRKPKAKATVPAWTATATEEFDGRLSIKVTSVMPIKLSHHLAYCLAVLDGILEQNRKH